MTNILLAKKQELMASMENLQRQSTEIARQILLHQGALDYNELLLRELEEASKIKSNDSDALPPTD